MIDNLAITPQWQTISASRSPNLSLDEVHIWYLPLALNKAQEELALTWLSDIQRDKYHRRRTPERQLAYLAGRYHLLRLLGHYNNQLPSDIQLSYSRLNKPYLSDRDTPLHFNFTDTSRAGVNYGVFAFSRDGEVGVDIEHLARRSNFEGISQNRFTPAEQALVTRADGSVDPELFLAIWTRKEAFGKATGRGINFVMNQQQLIAGGKNHQETAQLNFSDPSGRKWRLNQLRLDKNVIACVVHQGHQSLAVKAFNILDR